MIIKFAAIEQDSDQFSLSELKSEMEDFIHIPDEVEVDPFKVIAMIELIESQEEQLMQFRRDKQLMRTMTMQRPIECGAVYMGYVTGFSSCENKECLVCKAFGIKANENWEKIDKMNAERKEELKNGKG